jgi:soluble cytochrome b562
MPVARRVFTALPFLGLSTLALCSLGGCATGSSYVRGDETTLGRVVVYRNGVAYFERTADVTGDHLDLKVPADKVDDFLKSLTVVDAQTGKPAPVSYPTKPATEGGTGLIDMRIGLSTPSTHRLKLSYVTEAPSWKPSYRVMLDKGGKVNLEAWAIVDNTSGEDWNQVKLGVGSSSALSFRFDLQSIRLVERETLQPNSLIAIAPPMGDSTYGAPRALLGELDESQIADAPGAVATEVDDGPSAARRGDGRAAPRHATADASPRPSKSASPATSALANGLGQGAQNQQLAVDALAQRIKQSPTPVTIEGFASARDQDKDVQSLDRANRLRAQLVARGVDPSKIVAVGRGVQAGHDGGVRLVESAGIDTDKKKDSNAVTPAGQAVNVPGAPAADPLATQPIGTSSFESGNVTSVARGSSAMVSVLHGSTEGEVVYLFDPESTRGNAQFAFKSVRLKNPSDSVLETGPVTVFGDGRFIGEGMSEPIPARATAFVPFALDRQIVVERKDAAVDQIRHLATVQRGIFSAEVQHRSAQHYVLNNRAGEPATVYLRHTVAPGYTLEKNESLSEEKLGAANLFKVIIPAHGKAEVEVAESTPVWKTIDVRAPEGIEEVRVYLSHAVVDPALEKKVQALLALQKQMADAQEKIVTLRDQEAEYRTRMDELHNQIFTLKAVRTAGPLMASLQQKLIEVSDRLSKATLDVVAAQETLMVTKVHFEDSVADLTLEPSAAPSDPKAVKTATR